MHPGKPGIETEGGVYAVVKDGGKQYRVSVGDLIRVERRPEEIGVQLTLAPVLAIQEGEDLLLDPARLAAAKVLAEVVRQGKNRKILVFKKKRRKAYRRTAGHRQTFTELKILGIQRA